MKRLEVDTGAESANGDNGTMNQLMNKIDKLIYRTDALVAAKLGSPKRNKEKPTKGRRGGRMTEKEEDEILMDEETKDVEDWGSIRRLTAQPSIITGGALREYQLEGLNWLIELYNANLSGILADEMGLGKTLQTISLIAYLRQFRDVPGPHLVVVPLSTLGNWEREFSRWCPEIRTLRFHGTKEERVDLVTNALKADKFDVCLTSYEMAIKEKGKISRFDWQVLVVDEAHRLKNEESLLSQVLRMFNSRFRLLLTGTPLQNNLHELWALLNFLLPETFDSSQEFDEVFNAGENSEVKDHVLQKLHKILKPFMLRRLKSDVETSLKPKIETLVFVGMSALQKELYRSILMRDIDAVMGQCKERTKLLNIVMQLRKAANHPYLFDGVEDRTLPPEQFQHLIDNSGKLYVLDRLLPKLKAAGSRVLIFSQMTRMLDILEDYVFYRGFEYCRIDGNTSTELRDQAMEVFNAPNSSKFCFLLSTRAGGLGINLATADVVVLFDSDWNPQMDLQAQDRAHRIGQKKQVQVFRFITDGTIEEKIIEKAEIKLRLDAMVIQQGRLAQKQTKLGQKEMQDMIRFGADQIFRSKDSTITEEDIDLILSRGQQRTAEINEKLQKHVGIAATLKLDGKNEHDIYTLDGVNYRDGVSKADELNEELLRLHDLTSAIPKRERKARLVYDVDRYYREAMTQPKAHRSLVKKPMKLPVMRDFQLFNRERIAELCEKEYAFWEEYRTSEQPPRETGLTEEEEKEREDLLQKGFGNWNRRHFQNYVRALEQFGRDNIDQVCKHVAGQREDDVRRYHVEFWKRLKEIHGWERIIKAIEKGEMKVNRNQEMTNTLNAAITQFPSEDQARDHISLRYTAAAKKAGFTRDEDTFLLVATNNVGYGAWTSLRAQLQETPEFFFDYFIRTRSVHDLNRRVDVLIRSLEKPTKKKDNVEKASNVGKRKNAPLPDAEPKADKKRKTIKIEAAAADSKAEASEDAEMEAVDAAEK